MKNNQKKLFLILILIFLGLFFYQNRIRVKEFFINERQAELPQAVKFEEVETVQASRESSLDKFDELIVNKLENLSGKNKVVKNSKIETKEVIEGIVEPKITEINLDVPFTIQSPNQTWKEPFKEGCEEASVLMAYSFLKNKNITVDSALKDIQAMVDWQIENFSGHFDLPILKTAELANKFYNVKTELVIIESIEDLKNALRRGLPIILPTAGRELKNPHFKQPGPLYHMLVAKGFTKDGKIITNDPGTRSGKDYLYDEAILFNAIADWDEKLQLPNQNKKVALVLMIDN